MAIETQLLTLAVSLSCVCIWLAALLSMRFFGDFNFCVHIIVFSGIVCIAMAAYFTGGIRSPVLIAIVIPPVIASILASVRSAFIWCGFSTAVCLVMYMLDRQQYFNINLIPANLYTLVAAIFYGFACFLVAGVIYVHEQINTQLKIALESERKKFNRLAHIDELTGIGNRLEFKSKLGCSIEKAKANNEKVGIIYIDLDDFKPVNDIHGHEIGDHVLCIAAQRIKLHVRSSDTVVRLGGDEFAVILNSIDSKSRVDNIAKLMIKEINTAIIFGNIEIQVGASAGTSLFPDDTQDPKELLNAADKNMYARKNNKNN